MFKVNRHIGRVIEARIFRLADVEAVARYGVALGRAIEKTDRPVLCADHRPVAIYAPPVADQLVAMFTDLNKHWERVAILVANTNATLAMQLQRIVRSSNNPSRRVFFDADEARNFLGETLDAQERARVATFLTEKDSPPDSSGGGRRPLGKP
ncbi:hypothetical protein A7982_12644 [Minicystis rosea]|nr:hypothetical protein A7982_12644 [Minicystis rosea]